MSKLKLLRRPLPPKEETVLFIPKRKDREATSAIHPGARGKEPESKETPGDRGAADAERSTNMMSPNILFSLPDSILYLESLDSIKRDFIIPLQSSGPPSFPLQKRRIPLRLKLPALKRHRLVLPSDFILRGGTAVVTCTSRRAKDVYKKPIISHLNYEELCKQLMSELLRSGQKEVNTIMLPPANFPFGVVQKPERQVLTERFLEQHLDTCDFPAAEVLEEKISFLSDEPKKRKKRVTYADEVPDIEDASLVSSVHVMSDLGPEDEEKDLIAKAEMAILACRMHKKTGLSLKAYFIPRVPDLSNLADSLVYLNLSFNDLRHFPTEICDLKKLEILKLRNNPIKSIPEDITKLTSLKVLIMSFNLLTELPSWLFKLSNLELLDVSYNELEHISNAISNASSLQILIVEGNLLYFLPCGILKLPLKRLKVENNFLHPFFWREIKQLEPQRLTDMAALCFVQNNLRQRYPKIPEDIQKLLGSCGTCDCCSGPLYGQGLCFFRAYRNIYGFRLPYVFSACSPACYMNFITCAASNTQWLAGFSRIPLAAAETVTS
uniref:leucine-rich repeat-containing protein 63 n=1 Tax=Euleptes europaea TaxID=460621 RepID=UPI002541D667|nr:leucine-rich repeat-containing protein 63 [Euleptes europaea]